MGRKLIINKLKTAKVGDTISVQGRVAPGAHRFAISLGQDDSNYLIHFNPRFDQNNVIVYNSMSNGVWGSEERVYQFPFAKGEETTISFTFNGNEVVVSYPYGHRHDFRSPLELNDIEYISVDDDFEVYSINIH